MTHDQQKTLIALSVIVGFFVVVIVVLMGFVNIENPESAKLVGVIVGYLCALLNPVVVSYFKGNDG